MGNATSKVFFSLLNAEAGSEGSNRSWLVGVIETKTFGLVYIKKKDSSVLWYAHGS